MDKREKLKESFRQSKQKLKVWESTFYAQNQRKPSKEEIKNAPEQIQICYRNCWKIKAYFESKARSNSNISSGVSGKKQENCDEVKKITEKKGLQHRVKTVQSFNI